MGSGEKGQLGNGRTGEYIAAGNKTAFDVENEPSKCFHSVPVPFSLLWFRVPFANVRSIVLVKGLTDKKIVQIACGQQHSIALDDTGYAPFFLVFPCSFSCLKGVTIY